MPAPAIIENAQRIKVSSFEDVRRSLLGQVFHVTRLSYIDRIVASGALLPNRTGIKSPIGNSANGYFRLKGCVSFFDYRMHKSPEWQEFYSRCMPTIAISPNDPAVVMFLSSEYYPKLISWLGWKVEELWSQRVVPHVEVGFLGEVSLDMITEIHIWEDGNPGGSCRLTDLYNRLERNAD